VQIENLKSDFELSRIGVSLDRNVGSIVGLSGTVRPYANAKNLVGGNVKADKRVGYHRGVRSSALGSGTSLRRRASRIVKKGAVRWYEHLSRARRSPWNGKKERRPCDVTRLARRCR